MTRIVGSILCLIFALASFLSPCRAQSFRSYASGDLLYGDFDNDLDPIYIWDNDGYRLYSTLSNLSSSTDKFLSNLNNGVYLLGISGNFGLPRLIGWESRTMFLVQLSDSREDNNSGLDTDFDGMIDLMGQGYMSGDRVQFFDNNDDNIFDSRVNIASTADNFDLLEVRDWRVTHSYRLGDKKIGVGLSHLGLGNNHFKFNRHRGLFNFVVPSHVFSYSKYLIQTNLSTFDVIETRRESGEFETTYETPADIFWVAFETPFTIISASEIRFDISVEMIEDKYDVEDIYSYFRDVSAGGVVDMSSAAEAVNIDSSLGGYTITPGLRLSKHWNTRAYSWFDIAFGIGKFDADKAITDRYNTEIQLTDLSGNTNVTSRDYRDTIDQTGDTKRKSYAFSHKTVVDFTEKFTFAAGLNFYYNVDKTNWDADYLTTDSGAFDNGDGVSDDSDSTYTRISSMSANLIAQNKSTVIDLPVAMEYALGRWTFRFGATHQILRQIEEEDFLITSSSPAVTTIIYGDGSSTVVVDDNEYLSQGATRETRISNTNFIYGLEFRANDHLKIELLQFMETADIDFINTNFYRQLRLSMTVMF